MATSSDSNAKEPQEESEGDKLEKLISTLGCGRYQLYVMVLGCVATYMPGMVVVAVPFLAYEPQHRCQVPECEDLNATSYSQTFLNFTTPYSVADKRWSRCERYTFEMESTGAPLGSIAECQPQNFLTDTEPCGPGHVFDKSVFQSSIITDFDLWCVSGFTRSLAGMSYMVGMLVGAIVLGDLSDRIGRRNSLTVASTIVGVSGIVSATAVNYPIFLVGRFVTGAGAVAMFQVTFVLVAEFVGKEHRTLLSMVLALPFALGEVTTGILAYYIRNWRYLQLCVTVTALLLLSYKWIMPESVRWLISQNRTDEAIETLKKIAKINKRNLPEESLDFIRYRTVTSAAAPVSTRNSTVDLVENEVRDAEVSDVKSKVPKKAVFDLLKTPNLRKRTLTMYICWPSVTFIYYGLSQNAGNIAGNLFVNFILTMVVEIPAPFFAWFALDRMGRKGTLVFAFLLSGLSCLTAGILPREYTTTIMVLYLIGKFGASSTFLVVYVYATELFPTCYRGVGLGSCSMTARVGGTLAPLLVTLFAKQRAVAPVAFGTMGCLSGLLALMLPETLGCRLPQTLAESEQFGSDQGIFECCCCIKTKEEAPKKGST